jgi:hypothetical protein
MDAASKTTRAVFGATKASLQAMAFTWQIGIPCPHLGGAESEAMALQYGSMGCRTRGSVVLAGDPPWQAGAALIDLEGGDIAALTRQLYSDVFEACDDLRLCRIWHHVPAINESTAGLENYRAFCVGRARAFEERFGEETAPRHMPASSAVGCYGSHLALYFLATSHRVEHFENPQQVPAWRYPEEHGPRPPSFARATRVSSKEETRVYLAGTSSIKGHANVSVGDTLGQLRCTEDNLRVLSSTLGYRRPFETAPDASRFWKIYLRNREDRALIAKNLDRELFRDDDTIVWLQAEICRGALNIEIEGAFRERTI